MQELGRDPSNAEIAEKMGITEQRVCEIQKIAQDPKFQELNESDKNIMMLASLLHDITKAEKLSDGAHAYESSFDAGYISKKFNLSRNEYISSIH